MLDGLLKSKFYTKCKTNVKRTRRRVEAIKNKKIAVQKFLKDDIADLLRKGHDMIAYDRAEGFLIEQNMAHCYELVENFCANISSNLSLMEKQRECTEECKEGVASLNYAAARFADLPELRNLRNTFTERFGDSFQSFTNREFMERLSPRTCTKEMKLQLLQDIANEFSIEWDSKALQQKLFTPPTNQAKYVINDQNKETFRRRNPESQTGLEYRRPPSSSEEDDNSTAVDFSRDYRRTSLSSNDDAATGKTPSRTRPPPSKPEKSAAAADSTKPRPRSVQQRNNNLKPPAPAPGRAVSMPPEPTERAAGPARTASFQPDGGGRGVHPKLPRDYDELAARIAALRGKS